MATKQEVVHLFDYLWPAMDGAEMRRDRCLLNLTAINALFARHLHYLEGMATPG